ncbi:hypothetical protein LAD64_26755 [Klebsiella pneumoniae]|nr:hypothetical protein [Klebsiella pneumoniae]
MNEKRVVNLVQIVADAVDGFIRPHRANEEQPVQRMSDVTGVAGIFRIRWTGAMGGEISGRKEGAGPTAINLIYDGDFFRNKRWKQKFF